MNTIKTFKNGATRSTIEQARALAKNLGIRAAAGLLRNKGFSIDAAMWILVGCATKEVV